MAKFGLSLFNSQILAPAIAPLLEHLFSHLASKNGFCSRFWLTAGVALIFGNKTVIKFFFSLMSKACEGVSKTTHAVVLRLDPELAQEDTTQKGRKEATLYNHDPSGTHDLSSFHLQISGS